MSSAPAVLLDVQPPPLLLKRPPRVASSAAVEAVEFAEEVCGIYLDDWQRWVVELALSEQSDGSWSAFEVGIVCPRQNGKNFILEVVQIACIYLFGDQTLVHSAHKFDTSVEHFNRLKWLFENTPELSDLLLPGDSSFVTSNGKEHIRFRTGQRILFKARYRGGGRGFSGDKVFLDEAYDLPAKAIGSLIPTLSTRKMAQVWYTSSAPHESSAVLHAVRERAIGNNPDDRLFYAEWGNAADSDNDMEAILRANPAVLAGHITEDYIRQEILTFSGDPDLVEEHRRERLGIATPRPRKADDIPPKLSPGKWEDSAERTAPTIVPGEVTMAYDIHNGWTSITIAAGTLSKAYVECIAHRAGAGWLPERMVELITKWQPIAVGLDGGSGPAVAALSEVIQALETAGISSSVVKSLPTVQYRAACGAFWQAVEDGKVTRPKLSPDQLDTAGQKATERTISDSWVWDRTCPVPIGPLVSATIARCLLATEPPKPPPPLARVISY